MKQIESDSDNNFLRLIPPQWERQQEEWLSPWAVITSGEGSPETARLFDLWTELAAYYRKGDAYGWQQASQALLAETLKSAGQYADANLLRLEVLKNRLQPFTLSLAAYIAAFLLLLASFMGRRALLQRCAFWLLASGATIHALGIIARIMILQRPPVGTLYESVIWVGLIAALFGLILERRRHNGAGLLIGTLTGAILHMVGFRLGSDGDTMGMLIAVLNTNFWLTTHVLTITIGYGCCLVGGLLGHLYLLACIFRPAARTLQLELYRNMHGVTLVALLFTLIGTILGGIWADQSWGRFWGWDPKENGALLIVLWLIWLMHGRLGGILHELGYAIGMVFTNVTVALSWFGVNLLSVGLHSYGFIDSVAWGLGIFCTVETAFALITLALIRSRKGNANEG
ncbi:MAG: cytochrome c biogenesis protein CcsA [Hyphomicrobiales bacterium]|nr:cytochrome c biogenesis protein CcsA [Hyphomicrobiales bacterium]